MKEKDMIDIDYVEKCYEKQVDIVEEKTRELYEGKLYGAALESVVEKAKKDLWEYLKAEAEKCLEREDEEE